jgi:hypothetical protein
VTFATAVIRGVLPGTAGALILAASASRCCVMSGGSCSSEIAAAWILPSGRMAGEATTRLGLHRLASGPGSCEHDGQCAARGPG